MSSGAVVVAPVGLPVVAAGAVVLAGAVAVTAGAVLVARAVNAAAESAVRAVGESGARLEADIAAIEAAEEAGQWRRRAMADIVAQNARLRLVRERAKAARVALPIPRPLALSAEISAARAVQWVSEVDRDIARLNRELDAAAPPLRVTVTATASLAGADLSAELDRFRRAAADRHTARPTAVSASSITDVITLLDPDATARERDEVLADAAAIPGRTEQAMYVSGLRSKIVKTLNPRIQRRRVAATWVSALDDGPLAEVLAGIDPPTPMRGTADALREVVADARELTPDLHAAGAQLMAWAEEVAGRVFLRDLVRRTLADEGYEVAEAIEGDQFSGLRLSRPEWTDEHSAVVRVRDGNIIEHHLEAANAPNGDADRLLGMERCAEMNAGMRTVAAAASAAGVRVQLDAETAPQVSGEAAGTSIPFTAQAVRYREPRR